MTAFDPLKSETAVAILDYLQDNSRVSIKEIAANNPKSINSVVSFLGQLVVNGYVAVVFPSNFKEGELLYARPFIQENDEDKKVFVQYNSGI